MSKNEDVESGAEGGGGERSWVVDLHFDAYQKVRRYGWTAVAVGPTLHRWYVKGYRDFFAPGTNEMAQGRVVWASDAATPAEALRDAGLIRRGDVQALAREVLQGVRYYVHGRPDCLMASVEPATGMDEVPTEETPQFLYSAGASVTLNHPEIIVAGLDPLTAAPMVNAVLAGVRAVRVQVPCDIPAPGVANVPVIFRPVPPAVAVERMPMARGMVRIATFIGGSGEVDPELDRVIPQPGALQMFWPDPAGRFPWEDGVDARFAAVQDLTIREWEVMEDAMQ